MAVLLLTGLVAFVLAWRYWDRPALDEQVRKLAAWREVKIEGQPFGYSPLRGLRLRDAKVRFSLPNGAAVLRVPRGSVQLDPLRLQMQNEVRCESIVAEGAEIHLVLGPAREKRRRPDSPEPDSLNLDPKNPQFRPKEVAFQSSSLVLQEAGKPQPMLVLEGFDTRLEDLTLSPFPDNFFASLMGSGEIHARQARTESAVYSDVAGRFELIDGQLRFRELRFNTPAGEFHFDPKKVPAENREPVAELDFGSGPPTLKGSLSASIEDCRRLAPDLLQGFSEPVKGQLDCHLQGALATPQGSCNLVLQVAGREVGKIPFVNKTVRLVLPKQRRVAAKGPWSVGFKIHGSSYELEDVRLETDGPSFHVKGTVSESSLALDVDVLVPNSALKAGTFPPAVLGELAADAGRIRFPFVVTGSSFAPQAKLRREGLSPRAYSELRSFLSFQSAVEHFSH